MAVVAYENMNCTIKEEVVFLNRRKE